MDDDYLFNTLDILGPPFRVNMTDLTNTNNTGTQTDLRAIYGGTSGLTPTIAPQRLTKHGFNHWMVPGADTHPFLPPRPGWPGLMLRLDDGAEYWRPEEGTQFRVVIKCGGPSLEYVGQYEMVRLGDIARDRWEQQPAEVSTPTYVIILRV